MEVLNCNLEPDEPSLPLVTLIKYLLNSYRTQFQQMLKETML